MQTLRITTTVESDGELHLLHLPCRKGDHVQAILIVPDHNQSGERKAARKRFLARARSSSFRSPAPYPSRDALHERD